MEFERISVTKDNQMSSNNGSETGSVKPKKDGREWLAFYTRPRHEKKAADRLKDDFEIFCPVKEERVQWSDRWKTIERVLFTSYLFARINEKERIAILQDPSVVCSVMWLGRPARIRDEEIEAIRMILGEAVNGEIDVMQIQPGDRVKVSGGELHEYEGVVIKIKGKKARLRLESLQCDIEFTVDAKFLQKV